MGFFDSIGKAFKSVVGGLSKIADIVAPICAFIPGLNPVVTAIAAGIKAVDGLTDKPPNLGKMFEGVMGLIPGGALGKVLGPFAKLGGGSAGKFAEMFSGAIAGKGGGVGGLLGDVLGNVLGSSKVGGKDSLLGGLATSLFSSLAGKVQSTGFQSTVADLVSKLTQTQPGDLLSVDQLAAALTQKTGNTVERMIDGEVQQVPEHVVHPDLLKLISGVINQVIAEAQREGSTFASPAATPVSLDAAPRPRTVTGDSQLAAEVQAQLRRNRGS
jgi:hypothetical protein